MNKSTENIFNLDNLGLKKDSDLEKQVLPFIDGLPLYSPKQISRRIRKQNYVGQDSAVKSVSLMAYRHLSRLKKIHVQKLKSDNLPPKVNMLFVGPTGCGKTFLVEILFGTILKLPTAIVDMTTYSETGYVGQDVASILTRLVYAADFNPYLASIGVVCIDEFDKLASGKNNAIFAGAGTTKDVSGLGVQRELLKMLESTEIGVPMELSHSDYAPKTVISTKDIPFIACGAFSGLKGLIERKGEYIGFTKSGLSGSQDRIAVSYSIDDVEMTGNFINYGFLPELIGRFGRIIPFSFLDEEQLGDILKRNTLKRYYNEFKLEGIDLVIDNHVLHHIVKQSVIKETGARGIEASLMRHLENAAFEAYSTDGVSRVELIIKDAEVDFILK